MQSPKLTIKETGIAYETQTIISARTGKPVSFEQMLADLKTAGIVFIGETHTDQAHHETQLQIIQALYQECPQLAVGMEMFDRSYQPVLDEWTAGSLDTATFKVRTHWYANWRYNYGLYEAILDFIKENAIPLIGLNIPFYIPPRIAIGGPESLGPHEAGYLPENVDTQNEEHRAYVREVYDQHPHFKGQRSFENFYYTQCVWEDAMAESIAREWRGPCLVALMGNGHIIHKFGVPERASKRTGVPFRTVYLSDADGSADAAKEHRACGRDTAIGEAHARLNADHEGDVRRADADSECRCGDPELRRARPVMDDEREADGRKCDDRHADANEGAESESGEESAADGGGDGPSDGHWGDRGSCFRRRAAEDALRVQREVGDHPDHRGPGDGG